MEEDVLLRYSGHSSIGNKQDIGIRETGYAQELGSHNTHTNSHTFDCSCDSEFSAVITFSDVVLGPNSECIGGKGREVRNCDGIR